MEALLRLLLFLLLACGPKPAATPVAAEVKPVSEAAAAVGATPSTAALGSPWIHDLRVDHPLVGRIWRRSDGAWVDEDAVLEALGAADWRLLGEKHDNADHHRLQADVIAALHPGAVVFEQLDDGDAVGTPGTADELAGAVGWADSGWPEFALYRPIFEVALSAEASILPGHPTRDQLMGHARHGLEHLGEAAAGLPLDRELSEAQRAELAQEVVDSHCGHADEGTVAMMIGLQRLKDAWMARAMSRAGAGAVLVAGNGHTRTDRGVPHYLDGTSVTLSFREVVEGEFEPASYEEQADFVWFTPRVDEDDPCEVFKEQLEQMGKE